jgi:hypothetical protein
MHDADDQGKLPITKTRIPPGSVACEAILSFESELRDKTKTVCCSNVWKLSAFPLAHSIPLLDCRA